MQSNLIIKKQKPLWQLITMYKPVNWKIKISVRIEYGSDVLRSGLDLLMSFYTKRILTLAWNYFKLLTQFGFNQNIKSNM